MEHTTRFFWKIILGSLAAFALHGCASNAPQMSLLSDQDLCYQYLYIPTNDGRYDNYVYGEVEYRTYYKGLLWCDTFARGQANNIRETSIQRLANRVDFGDVLGQLGDAMAQVKPPTAPVQAPARAVSVPQYPTVKCVEGRPSIIDPQRVVEFASQRCPFGYTQVGN